MASTIDPTKPAAGAATTLSVRNNFLAAKNEIESLQTEVAAKQAALVSGSNIKTINGTSILGAGDIAVSGGTTVVASDTPPASPAAGDLWVRTADMVLLTYFNDGTSSQWVALAASPQITISATPPGTPVLNQLWLDIS